MHHIGYQTHHLPTGRYYIGIHSTDDLDDGYLGSGRAFLRAVKKHGRDQFRRHLVKEFATRAEACEWETAVVTAEVVADPRSFNCKTGGGNGGRPGVEYKRKLRASARKGAAHRGPWTDEQRARVSAALKGKPKSAETRQRMSAALAGHTRNSTPEARAAQSARSAAWWACPSNRASVSAAYEVDGVLVVGQRAAAAALGLPRTTFRTHLKEGRLAGRVKARHAPYSQ